jgi:NADPH-dependent dioxygenase
MRARRFISPSVSKTGTAEPARLDFSQLRSRYPFTLIINQNVTEQVLRNQLTALGATVEWATELNPFPRSRTAG